jgi:hypothetical protein
VGVLERTLGDPAAAPAIFGIILILFVYVLPDGLAGGCRRLLNRVSRGATAGGEPSATPLTT